MLKDHRPYFIKTAYLKLQKFYTRHFIAPHLTSLGKGAFFLKPWNVECFGGPISIGDHATVIATPDKKVRFSIWSGEDGGGGIHVGNCCLICPGVRISSASAIHIGDNCMIANGAYITDADWHGIYDRSLAVGAVKPVVLKENVWIGDSVIVCKGVTVGKNSIIGAGAVVTGDIPDNCIAAGNPARVVKELDPTEKLVTRSNWYNNDDGFTRRLAEWDRALMKDNTLLGWVRSLLFPRKGD